MRGNHCVSLCPQRLTAWCCSRRNGYWSCSKRTPYSAGIKGPLRKRPFCLNLRKLKWCKNWEWREELHTLHRSTCTFNENWHCYTEYSVIRWMEWVRRLKSPWTAFGSAFCTLCGISRNHYNSNTRPWDRSQPIAYPTATPIDGLPVLPFPIGIWTKVLARKTVTWRVATSEDCTDWGN